MFVSLSGDDASTQMPSVEDTCRGEPIDSSRCPTARSASRTLRNNASQTESAVRQLLRRELLSTASQPSEAVYEFWVPTTNARADVAVIGTRIDGFEIKTERDTLKRLPRQAEAYMRLFDRCHAVLAHRHVDDAIKILPPWWGVLVIPTDGGPNFVRVREGDANQRVDPQTLVRLLWRDEAYSALCGLGVSPDPRAGRFRLWELLLSLLDLEALKLVVRKALLQRDPARARIPSQRFAVT
jgi:hypothetical protein